MRKNRWMILIVSVMINLCIGFAYAWSVFQKPLMETFGWSAAQASLVFTINLAVLPIAMIVAGRLVKKIGVRGVVMTGGVLFGTGIFLSGMIQSIGALYFTYGLVAGSGIGLIYSCTVSNTVKWFPDKKGLITGLAVAGFGFGALIWIKLTSGFVFGPVDLTPGWNGLYGAGWTVSKVFMLYGVLFAALVGLGSIVMVNPPDGWKPAGWQPPTGKAAGSSGEKTFTVKEMVRTRQYWSLFLTFMVGATAGLMVIGVIGLFGKDALTTRGGFDAANATIITGTAMGLFYALMNGLGRIIWGSLSDKLGRKNSIVLMCLLQGVMMIAFYFIGSLEWGLYLGAAIIGFNFGGNFALFPAATADFFGNKSVGTNYPWVFMAYGVGGIVGPILGGAMGDARAWMWAFIPAGIACFIAAAIAMMLKPPKHVEA